MRKFESYVQPMQIKRLIIASSSRSLSKKSLFRIRSYTLADKFYKTNNRILLQINYIAVHYTNCVKNQTL